ncbi:S1 RNA-binding domain-containing protein, partial [Pseudopedobacter sp.]|uniref:S1 RNA-binding domain-containing protein n=1 Tax=Pseudopedobacter sp. TaxID=1936787 RepID=UPI0033410047
MAKKQVAEKELKAKEAELQDTKGRVKETFESEADSLSIDEIKSSSRQADPEDFDWDADDKVFGNYSQTEREKLEQLYAGTFNSVEKGEIISGTVVSINNKDVVLNIGFKSDGLVPLNEFRDMPELKVGDVVDVF